MTILVTGAGGFIGGFLARHFARTGQRVLAGFRNTQPHTAGLENLIPVRMDLANGIAVDEPVDLIVHAAAHTHLDLQARASDYVRSNLVGGLALADFARNHGTRLVLHLSTISVYGDVGIETLGPDSPLFRPSLYGASKYMAELILADHADAFASVSIRLPGVVAPGYLTPWLGRVLVRALAGETIEAFNPAAPFNNIVDVDELARCLDHLAAHPPLGSDIVTLAASEPIPVAEVLDRVLRLTKSTSSVAWNTSKRKSFFISVAELATRYGYVPASTAVMVERYVRDNLPEI